MKTWQKWFKSALWTLFLHVWTKKSGSYILRQGNCKSPLSSKWSLAFFSQSCMPRAWGSASYTVGVVILVPSMNQCVPFKKKSNPFCPKWLLTALLGFYLSQDKELDLPWWAEPYMVKVHHHTHTGQCPLFIFFYIGCSDVVFSWSGSVFLLLCLLALPPASYLGDIIPLGRHTLNHTSTVLPMKHPLIPSLSLWNTLQNTLS